MSAHEQKIREVGARDEKHQSHRAKEQEQGRARISHDVVLQGQHEGAPAFVVRRILLFQAARDRRQIRLGLFDAHAVLQLRHNLIVVIRADRPVRGRPSKRSPDLSPVNHRGWLFDHADHGDALAIQDQRASDDPGVRPESSAPHLLAEDRDRWATCVVFPVDQQPAEDPLEPQDGKYRGGGSTRDQGFRILISGEDGTVEAIDGEMLEAPALGLPVDEVRGGDRENLLPDERCRGRVPDPHDAIWIAEGERSQHDSIHHREHRGVHTDPEAQDQYRGDRERRILMESAHSVAEVAQEILKHGDTSLISMDFSGLLHATERNASKAKRFRA